MMTGAASALPPMIPSTTRPAAGRSPSWAPAATAASALQDVKFVAAGGGALEDELLELLQPSSVRALWKRLKPQAAASLQAARPRVFWFSARSSRKLSTVTLAPSADAATPK